MSAQDDPLFSRVLVALDASGDNVLCLECAAQVAAGLQSRIAGLFVEDQELLHLAGLPFSREVVVSARASRILETEDVLREWQRPAAVARRRLREAALRRRLEWEFTVLGAAALIRSWRPRRASTTCW